MKIIKKSLTQEAMEKNDWRQIFQIDVDGDIEIDVWDGGEPEDNSLGRDLNFVYNIIPLMKRAYEAGKNGEEFEVSEKLKDNVDD